MPPHMLASQHARAARSSRAPQSKPPAISTLVRAHTHACAQDVAGGSIGTATESVATAAETVTALERPASRTQRLAADDGTSDRAVAVSSARATQSAPLDSCSSALTPASALSCTGGSRDEPPPRGPTQRPRRKRKPTTQQLVMRRVNEVHESKVYNLTLDINDLKQQVRDYAVYKSVHATRALVQQHNFTAGVLRATEHLFHVFRAGYRAWEAQERAFLMTTIASDVAIGGDEFGVDAFMEQWWRAKVLLQHRYFRITSIRVVVADTDQRVVECDGELDVMMSLQAIRTLFPHILAHPALVSKLLDRRLVCPTRSVVYFDATGRIVEFSAFTDMLAALSSLESLSLADFAAVLACARIGPDTGNLPEL